MKNKIKPIVIFLLFIIALEMATAALPSVVSEKYYDLNLHYDKGKISLNAVAVKPGSFSITEPVAGYRAELISFNDERIHTTRFEIPLEIIIDEIDKNTGKIIGSIIKLETINFTVRILYAINGKTINIYDSNNTKVLAIDVGYFAVTCPNNLCEPNENYKSCPQDCKGPLSWIYILITGIIIIIGIITIIFYKRRKTKEV